MAEIIGKKSLYAKDVVQIRFVHTKNDVSSRGASGLHAEELTYSPTYLHQIIPNDEVFGYQSALVAVYVHLPSLTYWVDSNLELLDDADLDELIEADDDGDDDKEDEEGGGAGEVTDVESLLTPFIKAGLTSSRPAFITAIHNSPTSLPLTNCVAKYTVHNGQQHKRFGIYKERLFKPSNGSIGSMVKQEKIHEFHRRMAFLMFVQIDGASFIDDEDPRWEVFVVALLSEADDEADEIPISFVGYATTYPFSVLNRQADAAIMSFRDRIRISQVAIVPLYQRQGHGGRLVDAIYEDARARNAAEITVEDPSRGFRILRDVTDLRFAYVEGVLPSSSAISLNDESKLKRDLHKRLLITPGQARRCLEVHQLRFVDRDGLEDEDEETYKKYRLWVKRRLFTEFEDVLQRSDAIERKEKLSQLYQDTENEYVVSVKRVNRYVEKGELNDRIRPSRR